MSLPVNPSLPSVPPSSPSVTGWPLLMLRLEGAVLLAVAVVLYARLGGAWRIFALLFLAPDIAFLAYACGPRLGAVVYNALHTTLAPVVAGAGALLLGRPDVAALALVWLAHIGFDRMLGYGLKYGSGFGHTHLGSTGFRGGAADHRPREGSDRAERPTT